jgi:hypothetical protein
LIAIRACGDDGEQDEVANPSDIRCTKKPLRLESPTSHGRESQQRATTTGKIVKSNGTPAAVWVTAPSRELGTATHRLRQTRHAPGGWMLGAPEDWLGSIAQGRGRVASRIGSPSSRAAVGNIAY